MARAEGTLPDDLEVLLEGSVEAGHFDSERDGLTEALRAYFEANSDVRLDAALVQYDAGEIRLDDAADLVGVSPVELIEIIRNHDTPIDVDGVDDNPPSTRG